jgi:hypothetical protein
LARKRRAFLSSCARLSGSELEKARHEHFSRLFSLVANFVVRISSLFLGPWILHDPIHSENRLHVDGLSDFDRAATF